MGKLEGIGGNNGGASGRRRNGWGKSSTRRRRSTLHRAGRLGFETLEPRLVFAGVVINEFLAQNTTGLQDQDGDRSDWIELRNTDAAPVNLDGWYLTDDAENLAKWRLPSVQVPAGGYLLVFASDKDRAISGQQLHTNFNVSADGEFLGLVRPDAMTVEYAFDPYPSQLANVSYGLGAASIANEPLVDEVETARLRVPVNDQEDDLWKAIDFDDTAWTAGETGVGFERTPGGSIDYGSYFQTDVNALMPANLNRDTIYLRVPFNVFAPSELTSMTLSMRYDDGFIAYLNGEEIARRNAAGEGEFNSTASGTHSDSQAILFESIDVSTFRNRLVEGENVLAIHGLNHTSNRTDFLIGPKLAAQRAGAPSIGFMTSPSPGTANLQGTIGVVEATTFSVERGFFTAAFPVQLSTPTAGAQIRYTTNGSLPTATTGLVYNPASPPMITTTTILRAAAFKAGFTPSSIETQTFIFLNDVIHQNGTGLAPFANWGWAGPDWTMDPDIVNNPLYSGTIKNDLQAVPTVSLVMPWNDWFGTGGQGIYISGTNVERQGSIEMITADGSQEFQIDAALEIQGGTSADRWKTDKLSIRGTFKQPFGPTKLETSLFENEKFDEGAATEFDTLIFDAQINYTWAYGGSLNATDQRGKAKFIQDQVMSDLQNLAGGNAPHGRIVHLYINGLYWGIYMVHERPDDGFAESYLGGDKDDYDVIKHTPTEVVSGDATAAANYDALRQLVAQNITVPANYAAVQAKLDVDDLISYMLINYYAGNDDWAHHNWYASFNRVDPNGKWRFHSWDAEHVFKNLNYNAIQTDDLPGSPEDLHVRLMANSEYRLKFNDYVERLFQNGGTLSPASVAAIYSARMQEADRAIVGESARWGDSHTTGSEPTVYTRAHWLATQNDLLANYFPNRGAVVLSQFSARNWLVPLAAPDMSQFGGTVDPGFVLSLSKPAGSPAAATIYYTLDGTDPRLTGGGLNPTALQYTGSPLVLNAATRVQARIRNGTDWSPLIDATFLSTDLFPVRITELNYNPAPRAGLPDASNLLEFVELTNTGSGPVSLNGVKIGLSVAGGVAENPFVLPNGLSLSAGERIIVARNPTEFKSVYGNEFQVVATGYANQNLSNGGEEVILLGPLNETLQSFMYDDVAPWPTSPDGGGRTLVIIDPLGDPTDAANWRASYYDGGSPGRDDLPIAGDFLTDGVVNEADYDAWRSAFGTTSLAGHGADGNGDGRVDAADFTVWRDNLRAMYVAPGGGAGALSFAVESAEAFQPLADPARATLDLAFASLGTEPLSNRVANRSRELRSNRLPAIAHDDLLLVSRLGRPISFATDTEREPCRVSANPDQPTDPLDEALAELVTDRWIVG